MSLPRILADAGGMDISVKNNMDDETPNEVFKPSRKRTLTAVSIGTYLVSSLKKMIIGGCGKK